MRRRLLFLVPAVLNLIPVVAVAAVFISASPSSVHFPTRCAFSAADPPTVTVSNNGNEDAENVHVDVSPSSMSAIFPVGGQLTAQRLASGDNLEFEVGFNPVHVGTSRADAR